MCAYKFKWILNANITVFISYVVYSVCNVKTANNKKNSIFSQMFFHLMCSTTKRKKKDEKKNTCMSIYLFILVLSAMIFTLDGVKPTVCTANTVFCLRFCTQRPAYPHSTIRSSVFIRKRLHNCHKQQ